MSRLGAKAPWYYLVFPTLNSSLLAERTELIQNSFTSLMRSANSSYCLICFVKSNMVFSISYVAMQQLYLRIYVLSSLFNMRNIYSFKRCCRTHLLLFSYTKRTQKIYTPRGCLHENIRGCHPRENP